jgi:RNA polymerase sigma factor (sigma-70 family)
MTAEALWNQLIEGRKTALERLYRLHIDQLLQYGYRFSADTQLVEDCVQDIFVELWQKHSQLKPVKAVRAYLMVSLKRKIFRKAGQQKRSESPELITEDKMGVSLAIDEQIASQELASEQIQQLNDAIQQLTNRQKEALFLKYQQGLSYEEVCEVMSISYQSARNLIAGAVKRLKGLIHMLTFLLYNLFFYC